MSKQEYILDLAKLKRAVRQSNAPGEQIFYQSMINVRKSWISNKKEKKVEKRETREEKKMRLALECKSVQRVCEGLHLWL